MNIIKKTFVNNRKIIGPVIVVFLSLLITASFLTYSWYISTSNDANADTDEIKTLAQGYGGHFSEEDDYNHNSTGVYESGGGIATKALVKPGDVIYYAFLFDVTKEDGLKENYTLDLVLNAGSLNEGTYHNVTYGNYNNLLSHIGIEANTCRLYQLERVKDEEDEYEYVTYGNSYFDSTTPKKFTNTEVKSFYNNGNLNASMTLKMPTGLSYPADSEDDEGKRYFMIYIPIWYMDTETLQNSELECYIRVSSTIITEIESN